jgi:sugar (pentulose or hexulose) kinase
LYILGIDVGTTGTKTVLADEGGKVLAKGYEGYALITPAQGRVEQDARVWWKAVVASARRACAGIDPGQVVALALSTQGASSLLVDSGGESLTSALTWMDGRAHAEAAELAARLGEDAIYRKTGWRASPALDAAKLRWLGAHEPELVDEADKFLSTLEFINRRLTGRAVIDPTNAAMRQLMNLGTLDWDADILGAVGADPRLLPEIVPSGEFIGCLTAEAAEALGLRASVRVFNGAHDQYCACLGSSITQPGEIMLSTGTSWVLMAVTEKPLFTESRIAPGPHVERGLWGALSALGGSGAALDWFKNKFLAEDYASLSANRGAEGGGAGEVFFYPWLAGGGIPKWRAKARAAFLGFGLEHDRYDAARAIMEGVVFQMRMSLEEYRANGCEVRTMRVMGGALNSPFWTRAIGYNADCEVFTMAETDSACIGAAAIAGVGAGFFPDHRSAALLMNEARRLDCGDEGARKAYTEKYGRHREAGAKLSSLYE